MKITLGLALLIIAIAGLAGFLGLVILSPNQPLDQLLAFIAALIILAGAITIFVHHHKHRPSPSHKTSPPPPAEPADILKEASPQTPDQPILESKPLKEIREKE